MQLYIGLIVLLLLNINPVFAGKTQSKVSQLRPVHTYSIVARDPETGDMGLMSPWFCLKKSLL